VITAARLYDGKSDTVQKPGRIVVDGDKIVGVGQAAKAPAGAETIDLGDATLVPGLFDVHTHLTFEASEDWKQDELDAFKKSIPEQAIDSVVNARKIIEAGFTTVRDVGSSDLLDIGLRNAIRAGQGGRPAHVRRGQRDLGARRSLRSDRGLPAGCSRSPASRRASPTARIRCAPRSATTSSTAPT